MRAIHRTPVRRVGHVGSSRAAARALECINLRECGWSRADALGQARPIIRTPLRDRGRCERFLVEPKESAEFVKATSVSIRVTGGGRTH